MADEKLQAFRDDLNRTILRLKNPDTWQDFCRMTGWLSQYSVIHQLLIFAQKPAATAVATLKEWNRLGRRIRQGAKSIRLPADDSNGRRNVFDVSDTLSRGQDAFRQWDGTAHLEEIRRTLAEELSGETLLDAELPDLLYLAAYHRLEVYWQQNAEELSKPEAGQVGGFPFLQQRSAVLQLGAVSATLAIAQRCGIGAAPALAPLAEETAAIRQFNAMARLQLAEAMRWSADALLRQIVTIVERSQEHERNQQGAHLAEEVRRNRRSALPGGGAERPGGQLEVDPGAQPVRAGAVPSPVSESVVDLRQYAVRGDAGGLPGDPGPAGPGEVPAHSGAERRDRPAPRQGHRPDGLGGPHEQPESLRRGNRDAGAAGVTPQQPPRAEQPEAAPPGAGPEQISLPETKPSAPEPEQPEETTPPVPVTEPEKTPDEALEEHPVSIQVNGEWQTFPNVKAAEEASYEEYQDNLRRTAENFRITDEHLGEGGPKAKYQANINAIRLLKELNATGQQASPEQQEILSRYVGWGSLADAFDPGKSSWSKEYAQLKDLLTPAEYTAARASTLNAHYTSPVIIRAIYEAVGRMGFQTGRILEPSCGVGNFFGLLPEAMQGSRLYGVELDTISGQIARQLYPKADITVAGFETTDRRDFYDLAVGNVPFGQYQVNDKAYNKLKFNIHNYFFAKALDQVRPGGIVAFVTSRYTMDARDDRVRSYLAQRAELLGAIRLPNNAFQANAGAEVVSDILFLQKREQPLEAVPELEWIGTDRNEHDYFVNRYFLQHPEMVLGQQTEESTGHGLSYTVLPTEGIGLGKQLHQAVQLLQGTYRPAPLREERDLAKEPAQAAQAEDTPDLPEMAVRTYTLYQGTIYRKDEPGEEPVPWSGAPGDRERIKGMMQIRDLALRLIDCQLEQGSDSQVADLQAALSSQYDAFVQAYGPLNNRKNRALFAEDNAACLLLSLELLDPEGKVVGKSAFFSQRTIRPNQVVQHCDTPMEALAVSLNETGRVDMARMEQLTGMEQAALLHALEGSVYIDPETRRVVTAEEYLSGNVRDKLETARRAAAADPEAYAANVRALEQVQPQPLTADQIEVRLGAVWIAPKYIKEFICELFQVTFPFDRFIEVEFVPETAEWNVDGLNMRTCRYNSLLLTETYGTQRMDAGAILERSLNLKDVQVFDYVEDNGKRKAILNVQETVAARAKQEQLQIAFQDWIFQDAHRRSELVAAYNQRFNSVRNRSYDGSHLTFPGMSPQIVLRSHQANAVARVLYGGNTLLAHVVGAGKTFEIAAAAMEGKRIGLCHKSLIVVPNHLTQAWGSSFQQLYPAAKVLVASKEDLSPARRKTFCNRIATGDWDAVIIGHSQFERIPLSEEERVRFLEEQITDLSNAIAAMPRERQWTVKRLEGARKRLEAKLAQLQEEGKKDDVLPFDALGVDRLFVDEAQAYKNLFTATKMQNVAGISVRESQRAMDMYAKCRYLDRQTGGRGVVFATGTPISNSMTELYTMQRYLQYDQLLAQGLNHFDAWASVFGKVVTATELAPEGSGYRTRSRFAQFYNLPELMHLFCDVADIKLADQLKLNVPNAHYETIVAERSPEQAVMMEELSQRAKAVHRHIVSPDQDNMLRITTDGRKIGLDQRLIDPSLPDHDGSKVNLAMQNVLRIWQEHQEDRSTQLVFCDFSTPAAKGFNVYADLKSKWIANGIPAEEIAFIHDANTDEQKKRLFQKVSAGTVRILVGSTEKMGAGTNVQERLIAIHDVDCPWRPGDLEQRAGRIVRQGNMHKDVYIYRYATNATFDSYLWQTVESKQRFISQIMTSKSPVRSCEDVDEATLDYAEIKSLCAGNPLIKEKMTLDLEVNRLRMLRAGYQSQRYRMQDMLAVQLPGELQNCQRQIDVVQRDVALAQASQREGADFVPFVTEDGTKLVAQEDADAWIKTQLESLHLSEEPTPVGSWRGFQVSLLRSGLLTEHKRYIELRGTGCYRYALRLGQVHFFKGMGELLDGLPQRLEEANAARDALVKQRSDAQQLLQGTWPLEAEFQQKVARLTELNIQLSLDADNDSQGQKDAAQPQQDGPSDADARPRPSNRMQSDRPDREPCI